MPIEELAKIMPSVALPGTQAYYEKLNQAPGPRPIEKYHMICKVLDQKKVKAISQALLVEIKPLDEEWTISRVDLNTNAKRNAHEQHIALRKADPYATKTEREFREENDREHYEIKGRLVRGADLAFECRNKAAGQIADMVDAEAAKFTAEEKALCSKFGFAFMPSSVGAVLREFAADLRKPLRVNTTETRPMEIAQKFLALLS
jgi:hypothetical protein